MHVARIKSSHVDKAGQRRDYQSVYLRRSFRDGGKVKHEQLANLSALPDTAISAIEAVLAGATMVPAADAVRIESSLPHGHVAAVHTMAHTLGLPALLGPACRARDLAYALIVSRVLTPGSKLSTLTGWADTTLGADLGVTGAATDEVYAAMDWLHDRQDAIEKQLAARHLDPAVNPSRIAMFDLSSLVGDRAVLRAGRPRLLPRRQEGLPADRVRAAHRPGRTPGRDPGVRRQHRRPDRVHRRSHHRQGHLRANEHGDGRGPRHDHLRPHHRSQRPRRARLADRAARPVHRRPGRRRRAAADEPVR